MISLTDLYAVANCIEACPRKPSGRTIANFNSGLPGGPYAGPTPQSRTVLMTRAFQ